MRRVRLSTTAATQLLRWLGLCGLAWLPGGNAAAADIAGFPAKGWQHYQPRAIAVEDGQARFELMPTTVGSRHLLIVSSLNHEGGPFPVRLDVPGSRPSISKPPEECGRSLPALPAQARGIPAAFAPDARRSGPEPPVPPARRNFQLMVKDGDVASSSNYRTVEAELRGLGKKVQVYVDRADLTRVPDATIREIVRTFDDRIWPVCTSRFGEAHDADRDGRFTIFLTGWLTRLSSGRVHVDGFVRGADFDGRLPAPFSNHSDMMYLSTAMAADAHLKTVLAHEYAHAVIFSRKAFGENADGELNGAEEEGWLDEALAHLVEDLFGFSRSNLDYRISAYLSQPERYRLVVEDYYAANLFRSHGNRGGTYLFLRWCVDRFGSGLLDALIRSPRRGIENLESATGAKFADLYREWTVALALSGMDEARAGLGGLQSVELRGEMDGWILAGPRTDAIAPGDPARSWDLTGTSSRFFVIHSDDRQTVEVKLKSTPESDLQVTVIRLPEDAPLVELSVTAPRTATSKDARQLRFRIKERAGVGLRLGALAWEAAVPSRLQAGRPPATTLPRGNLDQLGIASRLGTSALAGGRTVVSAPLGLGPFGEDDGPIVFKLLGVDAKGRRVTAWSTLDLRPGEELAEGPRDDVQ